MIKSQEVGFHSRICKKKILFLMRKKNDTILPLSYTYVHGWIFVEVIPEKWLFLTNRLITEHIERRCLSATAPRSRIERELSGRDFAIIIILLGVNLKLGCFQGFGGKDRNRGVVVAEYWEFGSPWRRYDYVLINWGGEGGWEMGMYWKYEYARNA